ncbi:MAG: universal stress protein [Nocardiaceae bacterium]|nr:universal stress protein [Nocardiaceae bacterium]
MNPPSPIVVGVDASPSAMQAVRWAAADAARHDVELLLVNVLPAPDLYVPGLSYPQINLEPQERAGHDLLRTATVAANEEAEPLGGVVVSTKVARGPVVATLLDMSKDARMVVVGSQGLGALGRGLLGSVSTALARHAHCPVAVIHDQGAASSQGRVVVGVDGTENSVPAIGIAFDEASTRGAELVAVHAWHDFTDAFDYRFEWPDVEQSEHAVLAENLAGWSEQYPDVAVRRLVVADRATRRILEESTHADLVVVGSHGRGGFAGMMLGSTSEALLHSVDCPIIIVRGDN